MTKEQFLKLKEIFGLMLAFLEQQIPNDIAKDITGILDEIEAGIE